MVKISPVGYVMENEKEGNLFLFFKYTHNKLPLWQTEEVGYHIWKKVRPAEPTFVISANGTQKEPLLHN